MEAAKKKLLDNTVFRSLCTARPSFHNMKYLTFKIYCHSKEEDMILSHVQEKKSNCHYIKLYVELGNCDIKLKFVFIKCEL